MLPRPLALRVLAVSLVAGAAVACSHPSRPEPVTVPDVRGSIGKLGIPACDAYVSALEQECFGPPGHTFPPGLVGLVVNRVEGWRRDANEPGGRARVAEGCTSARESIQTFHCEVR